ncbi:MAG: hypothetical protein ABI983_04885, partial [Acidobacteriota bacterium]
MVRAGLVIAVLVVAAGCGKKGPPLAPLVRVPALITTVTPQRIDNDVYLTFTVPDTNADGLKPAAIGEVDVYAVTSDRPPATEKQRAVASLVATLPVRPILLPPPPSTNGSAPPPIPLPPGVDRGTVVTVREKLTADARVAVELPVDVPRIAIVAPAEDEPLEHVGPLVAPPPTQLPRRHYFAVAKSPRGRESVPSTPVSIVQESGSSAPGKPAVTNTAADMTITWTPSPDARTATFLLPPKIAPPVAGANATPANVTPRVPAPLPPLAAKSLGFNSVATTYHVYEVPAAPLEADPYAITLPKPLTPAPILETQFVIKAPTFGTERCFEVRPVDQVFGTTVIGPASPRTCVTAQDTFPPVAPKNLAAIAGSGVINLIWDPNTESDLAGYLVLRGEAPGDTLQPITKEPITTTSYRDESVRVGTRYVYVVVAVDRATPPNVSPQSNRAEET